jgi:O-acetyl-ADP-ribose deacetylase (regulator of RNase III)
MNFQITLCDRDNNLQIYFDKYLKNYNNMYHINADISKLDNQYDCIVSAGNSFGIMDGGVDSAIKRYFYEIDNFINTMQNQILDKCGYQQPGSCILLKTHIDKCKYIAHCPTMIYPLKITDYSIIYWVFFNLLKKISKHNMKNENKIKHILCPGLGTGCGQVKYEYFIQLIKLALDDFLEFENIMKLKESNNNYYILDWDFANDKYKKLYKLIKSFKENKDNLNDIMNLRRLNL